MRAERREYLLGALDAFDSPSHGGVRVSLSIASVRLDLLTSDPGLAQRCRSYFEGFLCDSGEPTLEILAQPLRVAGLPFEVWEDADPEFDIRGMTVVQRDFVGRRLVERREPGQPERIVAWLAPDLDDAIHNLLRWALTPGLLRADAFLLHGAAAVRDGLGYVFFGQSGAGKSTSMGLVANADPDAWVIGDDGVIIRAPRDGSPALVYAAPLGCGYTRCAPPALAVPIAGLYSLAQDSSHGIEPLSHAEGTAALLANAMNIEPSFQLDGRFELAMRFARAECGVRRLCFANDAGFWCLVRQRHEKEIQNVQLEKRPQNVQATGKI